jgi:alkane 1-monooxygenase
MTTFKKYSFLLIFLLILLPFISLYLGGWLSFLSFLVLFALVPGIDYFIRDSSNPNKEEEKQLNNDLFFKYLTYLYVPVHLGILLISAYLLAHYRLTWVEWIGFTLSIGLLTGGIGLTFAHELMHKNSKLQHFFSKGLLVCVCYGHFFIEHVKGHHVKVATPEDPATAQLGQSLYQFIPKSIVGSFKSALQLEKKRLQRKNYPFYSIHNNFWWIIICPAIIASLFLFYGGFSVLAFFIIQSMVAILLLETVNYIEHYGLERRKLDNQLYEKVSPYHSWNANHWFSNIILLHLQRHSDHHTYGGRPYQILRHMEDSPQLPSGYLGMIILAFVPPLWRYVMDKRVLNYRAQRIAKEVCSIDFTNTASEV